MSSRKRKPRFNSRPQGGLRCSSAGFTLLEVMIAVALIAIALVTLIGAQAQSISIATGSRFETMASLLAQWKLTEFNLQDYEQLTSGEGNFGEEYPHFFWKSEVNELAEDETGIKGAKGLLKAVDVTVWVDQDTTRTYTVRTILYKQPAANK
ncbi:prepilin-type N-terminal cleavage/methylation domain-containing protein [uncultured Desulfobulbus sp.]|uniref:prepilin-type N-terminal cleavage/methylation domain-containing protein n=1 Tax=uncultured Desulfobulbus sp. TaxID=239745 RepID=UPI0029C634DE|nr:prepilin-type N-terminal cleavage/methylation domain-containing protein [uncultured Desulfobulbus sp.]